MIFRTRRAARVLARIILASLYEHPTQWQMDMGGLTSKKVAVLLEPRRFRCFDRVHVRYDLGTDVWVPFLSRLRLRRAARYVLANKARHALCKTCSKKKTKGK